MKPKFKFGQKVKIKKEGFYKDKVGKVLHFYRGLFCLFPFYTVKISKDAELDISEKHLEPAGKQVEYEAKI